MDRDSDDIDIHDTETELDDEDLDDDCFLDDSQQSSQDTKSLRWNCQNDPPVYHFIDVVTK